MPLIRITNQTDIQRNAVEDLIKDLNKRMNVFTKDRREANRKAAVNPPTPTGQYFRRGGSPGGKGFCPGNLVSETNGRFQKSLAFALYGLLLLPLLLMTTACRQDLPKPTTYPLTCYAATYSKGIYKTENGGTSWLPLDLDQQDIEVYFKRIYLDPKDNNILYVATTGAGLYRLELNSESLEKITRFKQENIRSMAFTDPESNPEATHKALVALNQEGIFESFDNLNTWQPCNHGLIYRDVNVLFSQDESLYAGTVKDLFKWDPLRQWISSSEGITNTNIFAIAATPDGKTLYAGSGPYIEERGFFQEIPCLYKSTDQGKSWSPSDEGIPDGTLIYTIALNPKNPGRIYLGTSDGIYRSTNAGTEWTKMETGLPQGLRAFEIKIAQVPDGTHVIYAATSRGMYMTHDKDETRWLGVGYGLPPTAVTSLVLIPPKLDS